MVASAVAFGEKGVLNMSLVRPSYHLHLGCPWLPNVPRQRINGLLVGRVRSQSLGENRGSIVAH